MAVPILVGELENPGKRLNSLQDLVSESKNRRRHLIFGRKGFHQRRYSRFGDLGEESGG